jgi:hypothetical protein
MSIRALIVCSTIAASVVVAARPAFATDGANASPAPAGTPPTISNSDESQKIVGVSLLGVGAVVGGIGAVMAIKYNHTIGGCDAQGVCTQEDGRVPLGLGMAMIGASVAAIGTILWLQVPRTSTRVAITASGAIVAGTF